MLRVLEAMLELLGIFETGNVGEKTVGGGGGGGGKEKKKKKKKKKNFFLGV